MATTASAVSTENKVPSAATKILVVDDEPDLELLIRQRFRQMIQSRQLEFIFAHNGVEALSVLQRERDVEILLTDINMPKMDGLTLLARLRETPVNSMLRSIIVSAYGDMENIRTAMNRGAFDFITKPIDFNDLRITIDKTRELLEILKQAENAREQLISIQQELRVARHIQESILPKPLEDCAIMKPFELCGNMVAAREVGGDFYDYFMLDEEHLGFVIGDVSGKGVPAAIFMAMSRTLIRATAMREHSPERCLNHVNRVLSAESDSAMFVTVFYGVLNIHNGKLRYCNAGHQSPYHLRPPQGVEELPSSNGLVLGVLEDMKYDMLETAMDPGDSLLLYTDGVTEAMNRNGELYSDERLLNHLKLLPVLSTKDLVCDVFKDVRQFSGDAQQSDDITAIAIRFLGPRADVA